MATAAQYGGMFGPSPEEAAAARQAQIQEYARRDLNLTPMQQAQATFGEVGGMLGDAIGGAMGYENPAVARAKKIQQVTGQYDTSTSSGLLEAARKFNEMGLTSEAQIAAQKAREIKKQETADKLSEAHAEYYTREKADPKEIMMLEIANDESKSPEMRKMAADWLAKNGKSGAGGAGGSSQITRMIDPQNNRPYMSRAGKTPGSPSEVVTMTGVPVTDQDLINRLVDPAYSPTVAGNLAASKAGNKTTAELAATAMSQLPKVESDLMVVKDLGTQLFNHPGYKNFVGAGFPGLEYLQGSAVPGAKALVNQINGIASLMAREELRGQGSITENEAAAALAAFSRMNGKLSESDFRAAYDDFVKRVENVRQILRTKAGAKFDQTPFQTAPAPQGTVAPSNTGSGYAGGNKDSAVAGQLEILKSELADPKYSESDKISIRREISRLSGNKPVPTPNTRKTKSGVTYTVEP